MRRAAVVLALCLLTTAPAGAQPPRGELFGGYAFMRDTDRGDDFPAGWVFSGTGYIASWIGVTAEVGGSYGACDDCQRGPFVSQRLRGTDVDLRVYNYMAGPRVVARLPAVTPFAHLLLGGAHISGGVTWDGALNSGFSFQPGGGVDVVATPRTAVRVQADYRVVRTQGRHNNEVRVAAGLVWRFGEL